MKTTIELPDELFREAKVTAARRRMTLKTLFAQALRNEIHPSVSKYPELIQVDEEGMPYLAKRGRSITAADVERLDEASGG